MLSKKIKFERICEVIPNWKWSELKVGLDKSIITKKEIISYAIASLSEEMEEFNKVLELSIAEEDEVEQLLSELVLYDAEANLEMAALKWIFAIIYDTYIHFKDEVYEVIEDLYAEFNYPEQISNLVCYMPCNDGRTMDDKLNEYIKVNQAKWC